MCSFIFSTSLMRNLPEANALSSRRGPDATTEMQIGDLHLVHNLLSITGEFTKQPLSKNDVHVLFNGEIYNYKAFNQNYCSDGECIIDLYEEHGPYFTSHLDGEFAILVIDLKRQKLIVSSDIFGTKPLWLASTGQNTGVASYSSSLSALGYTQIKQVSANTTLVIDLRTNSIEQQFPVHIFSLKQIKETYDDWIEAFRLSVQRELLDSVKRYSLG